MTKKLILGVFVVATLLLMTSIVFAETLTIRPDGQGYYKQWANTGCDSGSNEWQCVDEDPVSTDDYLRTRRRKRKETFTFSDTGLDDETINSVTLYYYAKRYYSSRYKIQPMIRSGSNYYGNVMTLGSGYAYTSQVYNTNPATDSAWTIAEIDALEAGMRSYSSNYGGYVAQVYAVIDYEDAGPVNSCSDTDGGNIITILGTTSGYLNDIWYSNDDYCVDSGNIMEYYCLGDYETSQQQSCGTDYYESNYCMNSSVYRNYVDYFCSSGECDYTTTPEFVEFCEYGCSAGNCNSVQDSCNDTDGGWVILTKGTVLGYSSGNPYNYTDYCYDNSILVEYYCSGNLWNSSAYPCGNCSNGACI